MRTLMIERISLNETETRIEIIKSTTDLTALIDQGLSVKQLAQLGVSEYLTAFGEQVRVTLLPEHTFLRYGYQGGLA